jgi:hypothetical protein
MEDVLDLYAEPYDPEYPAVGFDERPLQLIAETRTPLPAQPGPRKSSQLVAVRLMGLRKGRFTGSGRSDTTTSTGATVPATCSPPLNRGRDGATSR